MTTRDPLTIKVRQSDTVQPAALGYWIPGVFLEGHVNHCDGCDRRLGSEVQSFSRKECLFLDCHASGLGRAGLKIPFFGTARFSPLCDAGPILDDPRSKTCSSFVILLSFFTRPIAFNICRH